MAPAFARWKPEFDSADQNTILYFKNLKRQWTDEKGGQHTVPCCSVSDCHRVDYDIKNGHYFIKIDGTPVQVPDEVTRGITSDRPNPTGSAIACYVSASDWEGAGVESEGHYTFFCFVPGAGT